MRLLRVVNSWCFTRPVEEYSSNMFVVPCRTHVYKRICSLIYIVSGQLVFVLRKLAQCVAYRVYIREQQTDKHLIS